jgi:hypothetical protein
VHKYPFIKFMGIVSIAAIKMYKMAVVNGIAIRLAIMK